MLPEDPSIITEDTRETKIQTCIGDLDKWSRWIQEELDRHKIVLDTFHALLPVSAFIAGIQAHIVSLCIALPKSILSRTANVFAFVGLFLDVIGTASGVAHSLVIQHKIKETTTLQGVNFRLTREAVNITSQIDKSSRQRLEEFKHRFDRFAEVMDDRYHSHDEIVKFVHFLPAPLPLKNLTWIPSFFKYQNRLASAIVNLVEARSDISSPSENLAPVITMVFGIVFLVVSALLVAVGLPSLSEEVWIACTVTVVLLTGGMIPAAVQGIVNLTGRRLGKKSIQDDDVIEHIGLGGHQVVQVTVGRS